MSDNPTGLKGHNLAAVLIVVAVCVTAIELMALYRGEDGMAMSAVVGALTLVAGIAAGRLLPFK